MVALLVSGIAAGAFLFFNGGEYLMRRHYLANDVRKGVTPIEALDNYKMDVDTLYEALWPVGIMLSPGINLATRHFKKTYKID